MLHLTVRIKRDVWMCVCLYHLRCQDAGRTVQGRECFIQLGHPSSDARGFLYDIDRIACLCDVKRGLNSGDTTADDERTLRDKALTRLKRGVQIHLCNGCPHQNHSLLRCLLHILVDPGAVLTDICDLHHVRIQPCALSCIPECRLMHARGAGAYHDSAQPFFPDCLLNFCLTGLGTHVLIILGMYDALFLKRHLHYFLYVYRRSYITSAMTDEYSYPLHPLTSCIF